MDGLDKMGYMFCHENRLPCKVYCDPEGDDSGSNNKTRKGNNTSNNMMEPMTMSPGSPTQYLPGFLLGGDLLEDSNRNIGVVKAGGTSDGTMTAVSAIATTPLGGGGGLLLGYHQTSPFSSSSSGGAAAATSPLSLLHHTPDYNRGTTRSRSDGPPIVGLFDDITNRPASMHRSYTSPATFAEQENSPDGSEGFWIVVYGFPHTHSTQVLALFSQLGRVIESNFPNNGNWMFLKYATKMEVRKALTYNEKIVCGSIMIGVAERRRSSAGSPSSQHKEGECDASTSLNDSEMKRSFVVSPNQQRRIRQLGYASPNSDNRVTGAIMAPQKDTSILTRAMDVLFGW